MDLFTIPNLLTIIRFPLAFGLLYQNTAARIGVILIAMLSDSLDGFLARRQRQASRLGAMMDPLADKFFMLFAMAIYLKEGLLFPWQIAALLSRDFAVMLFGFYLGLTGGWATYQLRTIWAGKVSTALQFFVLLGLMIEVAIPEPLYWTFVALGGLALGELFLIRQWDKKDKRVTS